MQQSPHSGPLCPETAQLQSSWTVFLHVSFAFDCRSRPRCLLLGDSHWPSSEESPSVSGRMQHERTASPVGGTHFPCWPLTCRGGLTFCRFRRYSTRRWLTGAELLVFCRSRRRTSQPTWAMLGSSIASQRENGRQGGGDGELHGTGACPECPGKIKTTG